MPKRKSLFKPLLFTTTIRNPERLKIFLRVLFAHKDKILDNMIIELVVLVLIKQGFYQPMNVDAAIKIKWNKGIELTDTEAQIIFNNNPQRHKEAGFEEGWPSRFDTWYKIAKELGFVYYKMGEKIEFSAVGERLIDENKPEQEAWVFANAFARYYRNNPFRSVNNTGIPLILLLETIQLINNDPQFNKVGIAAIFIPLLLCWKDGDANVLYLLIKKLHALYGYKVSSAVILDECFARINDTKRDEKSILGDYPDDFIRKMRLTGLISLRGNGRFLDINKNEQKAVNYILQNNKNISVHNNEKDFFNYMGLLDNNLLACFSNYAQPAQANPAHLTKWANYFDWDTIKKELLVLQGKKVSTHELLKIIQEPLRLEFLTALALVKKTTNVTVKANFIADDEGLPVSFAAGGGADIECMEKDTTVLVEVTMLKGTQQHIRESYSIQRHLIDMLSKNSKAYAIFISPEVFVDFCQHADFIKYQKKLTVRALNIDLFISQLETYNDLYQIAHTACSC
jgi:AlwI restriction endonuclease